MHVTQQPRQARALRTREQILTAAVEILVAHGYSGLTMQRVQASAGLSRGTLTHHFGSMTALAVAAIDHVAHSQAEEINHALTGEESLAEAVEVISETTRRPTFIAGLQLWVAAQSEPALRAALIPGARQLRRQLRAALALHAGDMSDDQLDVFVDGLLALQRGLAIGSVLRDRPDREEAVLRAWITAFADQSARA